MATCANLGCDQPGTSKCSACKTTLYCGPICQTADWPHHKEVCPGHLRKVGMAHLAKAQGFDREKSFQSWPQTLHHAELAATKLKQLKDRPVEDIDDALRIKYNALCSMHRNREALECAKEWYCLWPTKHTHPHAINASFALIQSCMHNKEFFDAALYARTLWETITLCGDSHIPDDLRQYFTARGARELARALWQLAQHGDMPAEEKQGAGVESIMLARRALEIHTHRYGSEGEEVASSMGTLADILTYFNDVDDDEVPRLFEQSIAIFARVHGSLSPNAAISEINLGTMYFNRAKRAAAVHDVDRCKANLELALPRCREAARIFRVINHADKADQSARKVALIEEELRQVAAEKATATRG